ncbi:MFS transporter [Bacillus sp. CGMCC 1.16541]|uniref:MFS transporter n=1 Tax=Bacillus sp. CGMCC 1.16541 TaxID=2185143 RepID=UPI000D725630|nr:MFS transporter [Bacillus sp. CGMCC 1.16541]
MSDTTTEQVSHSKVVLYLSIAVWLVVMNTTMFNVALPSILHDYQLSPSEGAWIVSGYSIVLAVFTIAYSRLADYLPIRRLMMIGVFIFGFSSILGFFATSFLFLLIARLCQAVGAAAIPGLAMIYAGKFVPIERRGRAVAMISSASSLGFGLGPVVGGAITDYFDWNYLFLITLLAIAVIPSIQKLIPKENVRPGSFDFIGSLLTAFVVTGFLLFLSTLNWLYLAASFLAGLLLWFRINKTTIPFIQPALITNKPYRQLLYMSYLGFCTHFAILFLIPIMLKQLYNQGPSAIGLIIFPGALLSAVAGIYVGRLLDRYGNTRITLMAHLLLVLSTVLFYLLSPIHEYMIMFAYMFTSFGFSSLSSSTTNETSKILPKEYLASAIGLKQLIQFVGSASGSVLGAIVLEFSGKTYTAQSFQSAYLCVFGLMILSSLIFIAYSYQEKRARAFE